MKTKVLTNSNEAFRKLIILRHCFELQTFETNQNIRRYMQRKKTKQTKKGTVFTVL